MAQKRPGWVGEAFIRHRVAMIESDAYQDLRLASRKALDRLEVELGRHGGKGNGKLIVTYENFESFGIRDKSVAPAIRQLEGHGLVVVTKRGRGGNADFGKASQYRLTYLPDDDGMPPTDEWRRWPAAPSSPTPSGDLDSTGENAPGARAKTPPAHRRKRP